MKRIRPLLCLLLFTGLTLAGALQAAPPLRLGIFPYFSPEQLATLHKPLKDYLARQTGRPIQLVSAPSFKAFIQRTRENRYDLLITAPHLGRLAEKRSGYAWLALTRNFSMAVFVSLRDSGIRDLAGLRGHSLALPPRKAIIHQAALETLEDAGLRPGRDLRIRSYPSHDKALYAVLNRDTDAAAFGRPTWLRYEAPDKDRLQVIGESEHIPGFALMIHPRVGERLTRRLRQALFRFAQTPAGQAYFQRTGLEGVREPGPADMALLDHYLGRIANARKRPAAP